LAPVVQTLLASVREQVLAAADFDPARASRSFTIAMADVGEIAFLPKLLARLMSDAPSIDVRSVSMPPRDLTAALQRRQVDLAIGYFPDIVGSDLLQQRLFQHGFVCLVRSAHPVIRDRLTQQQFQDLPHAVVRTAGRSHEIVEQYLKQHGIRRRELLLSPHFLGIPTIIAATDLIVTVPQPIGEVFGHFNGLRVFPPPHPIPTFDVKQYWHRSQHIDPGNRWLRGIVVDLFGE
jgi:DNA-binding transcriptional LysR family regulator